MIRKTLAVVTIAAALLTAQHVFAKKGGTSIVHFMVRAAMTGSGSGSVEAKRNQQGGADNQRLTIRVSGLEADTTYQLLADGSLAVEFLTDSTGGKELKYVKKNHGKASPGGELLPAQLDPISDIRHLEVSVAGTQTVLSAELNSGQYLIKRTMHNDGVDADAAAALRIKSNGTTDQLRIRASGLDASADYLLEINGAIAATYTADSKGQLSINAWPNGAPAALDVTGIAILNGGTNSVLSATLP